MKESVDQMFLNVFNVCLCVSFPMCSSDRNEAPEPEQDSLLYRIGGVFVVAVVLLVLGIFITYRATKWSIKKKLMKSSSQKPEVSEDLFQVR